MALAILSVYAFKLEPPLGLLLADTILSVFLFLLFKSSWRVLFLLHPFASFASSQLFELSFLELGDGLPYEAALRQYLDTSTASFTGSALLSELGPLGFFKYTSLGVAPVFLVPEYWFFDPAPSTYYLWQNLLHLLLTTVVVSLARAWVALGERHLLPMAVYAAVGPSFFELAATPTRHVVTFFGVFLFFVTYMAIRRKISVLKLFVLALSVSVIIISKAPLLFGALIFCLIDQLVLSKARLNSRFVTLAIGSLVGVVYFAEFFLEALGGYSELRNTGGGAFGFLTQLAVVGPVFKLLFALIAPFPWAKAPFFVETMYGGNWFIFACHVMSSLLGLYMYMIVVGNARTLLSLPAGELKSCVAFGLIMSTSVLQGSTGFHTYILIYFPFLAVLFSYPALHVSPIWPFVLVAFLELVMAFAGT